MTEMHQPLRPIDHAPSLANAEYLVASAALRIRSMPIFATSALAPRLPDFCRRHPRLKVEVQLRIDPGNLLGDTMPNSYNGCCSGPLGLCNAPDSNNNGVPINNAQALCSALGYQNGVLIREVNSNFCPQPHVLDMAGKQWTSDFLTQPEGYGAEWECTTFK